MFLTDFQSVTPTYIVPQELGLKWLAKAHARHSDSTSEETFFKLLNRFGCAPDKVNQRGTFLSDFTHDDWAAMQIFGGSGSIDARQAFFKEAILHPVAELYPEAPAPDFNAWIHVTCTGYTSPSVVQTLTSARAWGEQVEVLHAYHMGCYASIPALRMARGNGEVEILHTELCTLHLDPTNHDPEQLVIQSLFADGIIRYRATEKPPTSGYKVEALKEVIAPNSLRHMTWDVAAKGFQMTLSRDVPKQVQQAVKGVVGPWQSADAVYAIHPGGPRIIDAVKESLGLSEEQVHFSREVLRKHGNMSSATLPHVWQSMLGQLPKGTPVISLAFGPGLTIATALMRSV
jgi:predicted naringenin-chalcone synthase